MIFNGYENFLIERIIDLSQYVKDGNTDDKFYENFFKDEGGSFIDEFNIKTIFSIFPIFGSKNETKNNGLIDQLQDQGVEHVLLILPQKLIQ